MTIKITSTDQIVSLDGVPVRVWTGFTDNAIAVTAYISHIKIRENYLPEEFKTDLERQEEPEIKPL